MKLSVVIPVRDRRAELARCLAAIRAGDFPPDQYEIVIVDNGSREPLPPEAAQARVIDLAQPNRCLARNAGVEAARAPWIAFTDSDCVPRPDWLSALAAALDAAPAPERLFAVAGPALPAAPANPVEAYIAARRWVDQEKFLSPGRRFSPPFAATANLAVHRGRYLALGGLEPRLATAGEDADLCWRAAARGWRIDYAPDAAVIHHHRATLAGLWSQAYGYGIGNAELFVRWRRRWRARVWIDTAPHIWAAKGLLKILWRMVAGRTPLERREPFYDFLANTAMACGRLRGGLRHGVLVI